MVSRFARAAAVLLTVAIGTFSVSAVVTGTVPSGTSVRIAAGPSHSCAITTGGRVKCWGSNGFLELGTGATVYGSPAPVDVAGLPTGITAISAGHSNYTCALTSGGGVKCWGRDQSGQLGNGATAYKSGPVDVVGLSSGITAIAAGATHACALTSAGGIKCWGSGTFLTFANNGWQVDLTPVEVPSLKSGVTAIAAGSSFTCALTSGGGVKCWGDNHEGELGNGNDPSTILGSGNPVDVTGLTAGVQAISAYWGHACAITAVGGVKCWGQNTSGELGNGTTAGSRIPVDVTGLASGVVAIATGPHETCAITTAGGVKCWGDNLYGALGNGPLSTARTLLSTTPIDVTGLASGVVGIAAGQQHVCAVTSSGGVKCWGRDDWGQLGNGKPGCAGFNSCATPVNVVGLAVRQTIAVHPSKPAGTIARKTIVTFAATIKPLEPAGSHATARFEVYHKVSGSWRLATRRDVVADATGKASLRWTFSTAGSWYVRTEALANSNFAASAWSAKVSYTVR